MIKRPQKFPEYLYPKTFPLILAAAALMFCPADRSAVAQAPDPDDTAKWFNYLPLVADGEGIQSTLLITNVADSANQCSLVFLASQLNSSDFETHVQLRPRGAGATVDLPHPGSHVSIVSKDGPALALDSATLDCADSVVARVLISLRAGGVVRNVGTLPSAESSAKFSFPVIPRVGENFLLAYNQHGGEVNCRVELADDNGFVVYERSHTFPGSTAIIRNFAELVRAPAEFGGGSATVSCDRQIAATGMLVGAALSGLPPVVLSNVQTVMGFAPENAAAFDRLVVGKRLVSVEDARYYWEFPSAGQFIEVEPGEGGEPDERYTGTYLYSRSGPNTATLTANYSDGDVCIYRFVYTSATMGSSHYWTCNDGDSGNAGGSLWRLEDSQSPNGGGSNADDHGDSRASATQVALDTDVPGALVAGDTDYFRVEVNSSGTLEVYTSGGIDSLGRLEDADGVLLDSDDDGGADRNFRLEANVDGGAYYVRVTGYGDNEVGEYTLHVRFAPSTGGGGDGACRAGLVVNPGESCTYKGYDFTVDSSGRASIAFFSAGTSIDARGSTINGVRWNFHASKNSGGNSWTIHVAD